MMPGNALTFCWMAAISSGLLRIEPFQAGSPYGFSPTKYSSLKKPVGSVPSSGRPSSLATVVTCGKLRSSSRTCGPSFDASSNEMVYGIVARTQSAPSSRCGMNSAPMNGTSSSDAREDRRDTPSTRRGAVAQARLEHPAVGVAHAVVDLDGRLLDVLAQEDTSTAPAAASASTAASRAARKPSCPPSAGTAGPTARSARRSAGSRR